MNRIRVLVYGSLLIFAAVLIGLTWPDLLGRAAYALESGQAGAARAQLRDVQDLSTVFQQVAKAVRPSVVNIRSIRKIEVDSRLRQLPFPGRPFFDPFGDDLLERFFGGRQRSSPKTEEYVQRGLGTGVIVSEDGYIVTNNHVVNQANDITVTLSDNRTFEAKVVGTDEKTDLAVLKIEAENLMPAELGDSDALEVGQWVLAVGNPFGLSQTVTAGIISAKGRSNVGIADYEDFIQTDAAINPGNSGGPLVSLDGKVIGINTAIATRSGGYQGIGFAIPANMVKQVMEAIIHEGRVVRGWLGVTIQNLTEDLAASFGFEGTEGVLVGDVVAGGPADKAGFKPGDIIVRFDGRPMRDMNQLRNQVAATRPGTKVQVEIFREGKHKTLTVEIGELESGLEVATGGRSSPTELGLTLETLTPELARQLDLDPDEEGVVVMAVEPGSVAERAGLRAGDVIVAVGQERIRDLSDFRAELRKYDLKAGVLLRVKTEGMQRFVFLKR